MNILGIEASCSKMSVALCKDGVETDLTVSTPQRSLGLLSSIDSILTAASVPLCDLDVIAVSEGPGSFTGLRVGVSIVKGLGLVYSQLSVVSISSLEVWAVPALEDHPAVGVLIDAKRSVVYGQIFGLKKKRRTALSAPYAGALEDFLKGITGPLAFVGDGALLYRDAIAKHTGLKASIACDEGCSPRAIDLVRLAAQKIAAREAVFIKPKELIPKYLWEIPVPVGRGAHA